MAILFFPIFLSFLFLPVHCRAGFLHQTPSFTSTSVPFLNTTIRHKPVHGLCALTSPNGTTIETRLPNSTFSGYVDLSPTSHIFFLFFLADGPDPDTKPLTIWINGGPGSSSMRGAFQENGPCMVLADGEVESNEWSWTRHSNLLYIDQPVTTGLSYTVPVDGYVDPDTFAVVQLGSPSSCPSWIPTECGTYSAWDASLVPDSTVAAAPAFWQTLQSFLYAFPDYGQNGVNLATESYGGRYIPIFADYILSKNAESLACPSTRPQAQVAPPIRLQSILIGNGWATPSIQYPSYYNFTVYPGNTYDLSPLPEYAKKEMYNALYSPGNCVDLLKRCNNRDELETFPGPWNDWEAETLYSRNLGSGLACRAATRFCFLQVEYLLDLYANRDEYDIRFLMPDPFPPSGYAKYLNRPDIQAALGAMVNFTDSSDVVGTAFDSTGDDARDLDIIEITARLLEEGIRVVHYAGDADYICNWKGCEQVADEIGKVYGSGQFSSEAEYVNLTTSDGIWHGQVKEAGLFSFTRIFGAGHEVPYYQPLAALELFQRSLNWTDIATGSINIRRAGPEYVSRQLPGETPEGGDRRKSEYKQGNDTVTWTTMPSIAVYNRTTGKVENGGLKRLMAKRIGDVQVPDDENAREPEVANPRVMVDWIWPTKWHLRRTRASRRREMKGSR